MANKVWNYRHGWITSFEIPTHGRIWKTKIFSRTKREAREVIKNKYEQEYNAHAIITGDKQWHAPKKKMFNF